MEYNINTTYAGSHAADLEAGAGRFCETHPTEAWKISGVVVQRGLELNAEKAGEAPTQRVIGRVLDMPGAISEALEEMRKAIC
jgi:hypothetical protein